MASLQRELYAGEEEEQYATPPRVPPPGEIIDDSSETSDGAVPADPVSGQVAGQMTPTPTPGGGVGAICTPDTSSSGTIGSTPVDPDHVDQPASRREFLRLRRYLKETRLGLVEEVVNRSVSFYGVLDVHRFYSSRVKFYLVPKSSQPPRVSVYRLKSTRAVVQFLC